jgi:hypothetical protein
MEDNLKIDDYTPEEYEIFRELMLEEAWHILSEKQKYLKNDSNGTVSKILQLDRITDFFYIEEELEIMSEINSVKKMVIVRHFLKDHIKDI